MNSNIKIVGAQKEISLTNSVVTHRERMELELISGLDEFVVGQNDAKKALVRTIIEGLFNVYRDQGVLGAVFLGGPTGVGKTELARSLARTLLGDPGAITKISADTMPHPADISQLIGSSAGYIGYGDTPEMSDTNVHRGYKEAKEKNKLHSLLQGYEAMNFSIVLVDEIEKAHPDIPNAFLGAIQSGEMKMASGKESEKKIKHSKMTDLRNTLFIFTSNIGEHEIAMTSKKPSIGFTSEGNSENSNKDNFEKALKKYFAPEFIGRMDSVVRCHSLSEDELRSVFDLHKARINNALKKGGYYSSLQVHATREYVDNIIRNSGGLEYGARAIVPAIKKIGTDVGLAIQSGKIPNNAHGILEFDVNKNFAETLKFVSVPEFSTPNTLSPKSNSKAFAPHHIKNIVEGKINTYGDRVRETVQCYVGLMTAYDSGFADTCRIFEKRLRGFGFNTKDISDLQIAAFISIYQSIEQPAGYEIIVRSDKMFGSVGFRSIEKFLRTAIVKSFPLEKIYQTIRILLRRPMTKEESIVISQHMHRLISNRSHS